MTQPAVDRFARDPEHHRLWPGLALVLAGLLAVFWGAQRLTGLDTVGGGAAREVQLMKAFSNGGLEWRDPAAPPDPRLLEDPAQLAAALEQWERENAGAPQGKLRYTVNTSATTPCPT